MNTSIIRVITADDHAFLLEGVNAVLQAQKNIEIVAQAATVADLVRLTTELKPDLIIADLRFEDGDGIKAWHTIKQMASPPQAIILSVFDDEFSVLRAAKEGVLGYITKDARTEFLLEAITAVMNGELYYSPQASRGLVLRLVRQDEDEFTPEFTALEREIIMLICGGKTSKQISQEMFIGQRTVERYRGIILKKAGVKNAEELITYAKFKGWYLPPPL